MPSLPYQHVYAGHVLASALLLPELLAAADGSAADFRVESIADRTFPDAADCHWRHDFTDANGGVTLSCARIDSDYFFRFPGVAEAKTSRAGGIQLWRDPAANFESLRHVLLDQILPRLLAQRGHLVLHGSAVRSADGRTMVMLGDSGQGKSTLAGAYALSGGRLLTDDCVVLDFANDRVRAVRSYPGLRLWPDSLTTLFAERSAESAPMAHYSDKRRLTVDAPGADRAAIDAILVLQRPPADGAIAIAPLPPQAACMALVRNSFQLDLGDHALVGQHLTLAAAASRQVPVLSLAYPRDYARLPDVISALRLAVQ